MVKFLKNLQLLSCQFRFVSYRKCDRGWSKVGFNIQQDSEMTTRRSDGRQKESSRKLSKNKPISHDSYLPQKFIS